MRTKFLFLIFLATSLFAQEFKVDKVSGTVKLLRGTSEKWEGVKVGQILNGSDLLLTDAKSLIQLSSEDEKFLLKSDAAIDLDNIKKISINDLILALTLDEIRNVPKVKKNSLSKNTAVYGSEVKSEDDITIPENVLGEKKINGAKQLNESGYKESSIVVAKEVFRNYPQISQKFEDRMYFANLLEELNLSEEAASEYQQISKLDLTENQSVQVKERLSSVNLKLVK